VKCVMCRSGPEVLHENQPNLHFDLQLLGFWVAMSTINGTQTLVVKCILFIRCILPSWYLASFIKHTR